MDPNSIPSYHLHLAQISTGQQDCEYLPVQTTDLIPQSVTLPGLPPSYNSYPSVFNWAESRLVLESQLMDSHPDLGYSSPWGATTPGLGEQQLSLSDRIRGSQPETVAYTYQPPSSTFPVTSSSLMDQSSPRAVKSDPDMSFQQGHQISPMWTNHENINYHSMELEHALKLEDSDGTSLSIPITPQSPISTTSHHSSFITHHSSSHSSHSSTGTRSNPTSIMADSSLPRTSPRDSEEDYPTDSPSTDPPYSQLIYQALKETEGHRLQLQDIYAWFEKNTNKGKDQGKGWQNSIRHNLSMNAGFEAIKTDVPGGKKAVNYWSLTAQAISKGRVESTTRYRRSNPKKSPVASQRGSAKVHKGWDEARQAKHQKHHPIPKSPSQQLGYARSGESGSQYQVSPVSTASQQIFPYAFDYDKVVACTPSSHGNSPMFCDNVDPVPNWGPVRVENYEWYSGPKNGAGSEDQLTMHGHVMEERWG